MTDIQRINRIKPHICKCGRKARYPLEKCEACVEKQNAAPVKETALVEK